MGSSIARDTDAGVHNHAGPEIGVASTKAFLSQATVFALLALLLGRQRKMDVAEGKKIAAELLRLPDLIAHVLERRGEVKAIAECSASFSHFLFLGRKYGMPIACEGALKLKEIAYIHAEGYAAGEMKHGPIALIDKTFPSLVICPKDSVYEKTVNAMEELRARGGPVIALTTDGNEDVRRVADEVLFIPETSEMLMSILAAVPLQLFAYFVAVAKGHDPDKPRNLAKSVTVE